MGIGRGNRRVMTSIRQWLEPRPGLARVLPFVVFAGLTFCQVAPGESTRYWVYAGKDAYRSGAGLADNSLGRRDKVAFQLGGGGCRRSGLRGLGGARRALPEISRSGRSLESVRRLRRGSGDCLGPDNGSTRRLNPAGSHPGGGFSTDPFFTAGWQGRIFNRCPWARFTGSRFW